MLRAEHYLLIGRTYTLEHYGYCFYDQRIRDTLAKYDISSAETMQANSGARIDVSVLLSNHDHIPDDCRFALERNEFIRIADAFTDFVSKLERD